jgi:hypothetical protein
MDVEVNPAWDREKGGPTHDYGHIEKRDVAPAEIEQTGRRSEAVLACWVAEGEGEGEGRVVDAVELSRVGLLWIFRNDRGLAT